MLVFFLQSTHPQPSLTGTSRPPPLSMTLPGLASRTRTQALEKRATWPDPWMAQKWVWGSAWAWWGERRTGTEIETWVESEEEVVQEEARICCVACLTCGGRRRAFWTLPKTPAPPLTPAKPRLHPSPASAKPTKASMSRWDDEVPHSVTTHFMEIYSIYTNRYDWMSPTMQYFYM